MLASNMKKIQSAQPLHGVASVNSMSRDDEKSTNAKKESADDRKADIAGQAGELQRGLARSAQKEKPLLIVIGLFLAYGYYNALRGAFPLQMRNVAKDLNIPVARIGLPSSVFSAFYGIGISAMWGLQGLLQALGWPFLSRVVFDKLAKEDRAKYWGILSMAGSVGSMLAPYSAVLANAMGLSWRGALRMVGSSSALVTLLVHVILKRGGAHGRPQLIKKEAKELTNGQEKTQQQPQSSWSNVLRNPVLLSLMLCNSLSFGASKCTKEWGPMYLRGTSLASTDLQSANLLFWAEVGGALGAALSGFVSLSLGGRHAITCLLSAALASVSTGALAFKSFTWKGDGQSPMPFGLTCMLQACSLAGINGVRTLAGLHMAEVAAYYQLPLGLAAGFGELIGQLGSVLSGLPMGAIVARATSRAKARGKSAAEAARIGWAMILVVLGLASAGMATLNLMLVPAENKRLLKESNQLRLENGQTRVKRNVPGDNSKTPDDKLQGA